MGSESVRAESLNVTMIGQPGDERSVLISRTDQQASHRRKKVAVSGQNDLLALNPIQVNTNNVIDHVPWYRRDCASRSAVGDSEFAVNLRIFPPLYL
jgi:hypothetical protein